MGTSNLGRVRGSLWYSGNMMTGTSLKATVFKDSGIAQAFVWDKYLAVDGKVYECVKAGPPDVAEWIYAGNLQGPMPELVNELDSTDVNKALSADAGRRLNEKIENSGILAKNIIIDSLNAIYTVKVKIDNASTKISITDRDGMIGVYEYQKQGTGKTVSVIITIGDAIGLDVGAVLKSIESNNAYIYQCDLYDDNNDIVTSIVPSIWKDVNILKEDIEPAAVISETSEDTGEVANYRSGALSKILNGLRTGLSVITHAKAVWWNKLDNKTVYDKVEGDCLQYANVITDLDDMAAITEENAGKYVPDARALAQLNGKIKAGYLYTPLQNSKAIHSFEVVFDAPFDGMPAIVCTPTYYSIEYIRPLTFMVDAISNRGFTILVCSENEGSDGVSLGFYWLAIKR